MYSPGRSIQGPRLVIGLFVLVLGVLFLLDNLGFYYVEDLWRWWPVGLVAVGLVRLLQSPGRRTSSLGLIIVGALLLLHNLRWLDFDVWELWPAFLILVGLSMVWGAIARQRPRGSTRSGLGDLGFPSTGSGPGRGAGASPDWASAQPAGETGGLSSDSGDASGVSMDAGAWIKATAILSSSNRGSNSIDFRGAEATAVLGGCELDLRQATIAGSEAVVDVFAFWGGIDIRVPEGWSVDVQATAILGGVSDGTRRPAAPGKQLIVKGLVIMGGVDVQN